MFKTGLALVSASTTYSCVGFVSQSLPEKLCSVILLYFIFSHLDTLLLLIIYPIPH